MLVAITGSAAAGLMMLHGAASRSSSSSSGRAGSTCSVAAGLGLCLMGCTLSGRLHAGSAVALSPAGVESQPAAAVAAADARPVACSCVHGRLRRGVVPDAETGRGECARGDALVMASKMALPQTLAVRVARLLCVGAVRKPSDRCSCTVAHSITARGRRQRPLWPSVSVCHTQ